MNIGEVQKKFTEIYGGDGEILSFHAPGRVNLIGEHTDYNGGYVFPCALSFGTYAVARRRSDNLLRMASTNFDLRAECPTDSISRDDKYGWANYLLGMADQIQKNGAQLSGLDILIDGNIPNGAGLSSSASIELVMGVALNELNGLGLDMLTLVKLAQKAENQFIGVNCGIMDQFAIGMGKKDSAMLLDCRTLAYEYVPVKLAGHSLVIGNTNYRRGLSDSKYNERRAECERAVEFLKAGLKLDVLCDITAEEFEANKALITDKTVLKRAVHVVYENKRTKDAVTLLRAGDLAAFGGLMNASHDSLRDYYEVTGAALDTMVEYARMVDGVVGARMTGAGFGGCTISIVKDGAVKDFVDFVGMSYEKTTGLKPEFYVADVGDGAKRV